MKRSLELADYLYRRFEGRVPLCVGFINSRREKVYPFVFEDAYPIGLIGLAALEGRTEPEVQLFHISSFKTRNGHGSTMLNFICREADRLGVTISLQAEVLQLSRSNTLSDSDLVRWYRKFGFEGNRFMKRQPHSNHTLDSIGTSSVGPD